MNKTNTELQAVIAYEFKTPALLAQALTHKSHSGLHNERLEFLGDAILTFVIADLLYDAFPRAKEGELTRRRANLVNGRALSNKAKQLMLGQYIQLGQGEKLSGGFRRESILANCFEALVGAIYLDGGYDLCLAKIKQWFAEDIQQEQNKKSVKDPKTVLQEWLQARKRALPEYTVIDIVGPQHDQTFHVALSVAGEEEPINASGRSRRIAEQKAAQQFLQQVAVHEQ